MMPAGSYLEVQLWQLSNATLLKVDFCRGSSLGRVVGSRRAMASHGQGSDTPECDAQTNLSHVNAGSVCWHVYE